MKVLELMGVIGDADMLIGFAVFVVSRRGRWRRFVIWFRRQVHEAEIALDAILRADRKLT